MNATIVKCLGELVCNRHGMSTWLAILDIAAARTSASFGTIDEVSDEDMVLLLDATLSVLSLSRTDAFSAFVRGLVEHYAPRVSRTSLARLGEDPTGPTDYDLTA